jgi:hypothetical protein
MPKRRRTAAVGVRRTYSAGGRRVFATHQGWNVWLVGDSHRWAAGVIFTLGVVTCGLGSPDRGAATRLLATLGVIALVLAVLALVTGSLTPLSLLVVDIIVLWAASTYDTPVTDPGRLFPPRRSARRVVLEPSPKGVCC